MQKKNLDAMPVRARGMFADELTTGPFARASAPAPVEDGRGRPPRSVEELSDRSIKVRMTKGELSALRRAAAKAGEANLSNFVRSFLPLDDL